MVLAGEEFRATESTHGRRIWRPADDRGRRPSGGDREVLIWDLAGQPGYRIVHQLHLGGAALALIVFDSRNETAPLLGVRHWARAVRHAHPITVGRAAHVPGRRQDRPRRHLRLARADRAGDGRVRASIEYFKTSALEGTNIDLLRSRILAAIDWERIPKITSTALFAAMKQFVIDQKSAGNLLTPLNDLSQAFQEAVPSSPQLLSAEDGADLASASSPPR